MKYETWMRVITRPAGNLLATLLVHAVVVAAIGLAVAEPGWGWISLLGAAVPYAFWYRAMVRAATALSEISSGSDS